MSGQPFRRDVSSIDHGAIQRRQALDDGVDHLKRASKSLLEANGHDSQSMRDAVLNDAHRRLQSMLSELRALE